MTLSSTKLYDFCDPVERAEWLDILIALIEYLRSGESKVGFLNQSLDRNMLHKSQEDEREVENQAVEADDRRVDAAERETSRGDKVVGSRKEVDVAVGEVCTLRRSSRKRNLRRDQEERDTKFRRKR